MTVTPPLKVLALQLLSQGPLRLTPDVGWRSEFSDQVFNSHTIHWLASQGYGQFDGQRITISITREGRAATGQEAA